MDIYAEWHDSFLDYGSYQIEMCSVNTFWWSNWCYFEAQGIYSASVRISDPISFLPVTLAI